MSHTFSGCALDRAERVCTGELTGFDPGAAPVGGQAASWCWLADSCCRWLCCCDSEGWDWLGAATAAAEDGAKTSDDSFARAVNSSNSPSFDWYGKCKESCMPSTIDCV